MRTSVFLSLVNLLSVVKCSRILLLFPSPAPSHFILGNALAKGLANAGHDVTLVSPFEDKEPPKNGKYRDVLITGALEILEEQTKKLNTNLLDWENVHPVINILYVNFISNELIRRTLEHPNFKQLLNSGEQFDAIIMEQFLNDALKAVSHYYKAPLILLSTISANPWVNSIAGNPSPPSYIPNVLLSYIEPLSFWQRLTNFLYNIFTQLVYDFMFIPVQNKMIKEHFPDAPDVNTLNRNVSIILLNSHESTNQPVPYVPNMVNIGGYHVKPPKKLPEDLKNFMDNATEGVVYFSMGSNIQPSIMPKKIREAILKALGKLKQKVLWKWNEDALPGKPDNVKIAKWFPQQEILAHPNTKLFITHGGLLSTTETVYHGVPILAFPIFGDQKVNAGRAEKSGIGITLPFSKITEEKLSDALDKLLNDPKYSKTAKVRSSLMHDRPVKPLDLAVYWVEFVIRHNGADHLRVAALDLPWYQYLLLDVVALIGLLTISLVVILYFAVRGIYSKIKTSRVKLKKN